MIQLKFFVRWARVGVRVRGQEKKINCSSIQFILWKFYASWTFFQVIVLKLVIVNINTKIGRYCIKKKEISRRENKNDNINSTKQSYSLAVISKVGQSKKQVRKG